MASVVLTQGTIEYLLFDWADTASPLILTTLVGTNPVFDVESPNNYLYYSNASASAIGLTQYCLINTSTSPGGSPSAGGMWLPDTYRIWVKLTSPPGAERPRLGPFTFQVQI